MALLAESNGFDKVLSAFDGSCFVGHRDRRHLDVIGLVDSRAANEIQDHQDDDY